MVFGLTSPTVVFNLALFFNIYKLLHLIISLLVLSDLSASGSSHDSRWSLNDASCSEKDTTSTPCKERVSWPTMSDDSAWKQFDDDLEMILETTMQAM